MSVILNRLDAFRKKIQEPDFLGNKGLSNEVGLYIFSYQPEDEIAVRHFLKEMKEVQNVPRIIFYDLYEILMDICRDRRIIDRIPAMEAQRGSAFMMNQIQRIAPPEAYIERMKYQPHQYGDVVVISGIGRVYPYMRSHNILNNLQHVFDDIPVVLLYPGEYTGQSLTLFNEFSDDNYYRAFNLL
ncbi:MAG: DUF1788 domain-containing protein [Clostridia bacterium]|nr:DUF1788 domain-containing protein [Clostridia bacterium]